MSVQSQKKQHPILNLYSKLSNFKPKSILVSQMDPRSSRKNDRNDLGHDLDQLTKGNQHEVNLSPHPSLTVMVQPNKIDYSERSNNGGFRIFVHRPFIPATDPDSAVYINNNAEAFVNVDYKRDNEFERKVQTFPCWHTVDQENLWFDLEVEIVYAETYSREACVHEWQAKTLFRICKCLPYYYTQVFDWNWGRWDETLRCNHHGLKCFALVNSKFLELFLYQTFLC